MRRLGGLVLALVVGSLVVPVGSAAGSSSDARADSARTAHRYREYVALGDSWTADIGTSPPTSEGRTPRGCLQSPTDYPHQVAASLNVATFRDASCTRAATRHLRRPQPRLSGDETNPPQYDRLTRRTDLVTLGIGVNDFRLFAAIGKCMARVGLGNCRSAYFSDGVDLMSEAIRATGPKMAKAIRGIRARSPRARILLVNYLAGLPADGEGCQPTVPISDGDMAWFQERFLEMNAMLGRVARRKRVELVNTYRRSVGHDICQEPDVRYVEGLAPLSGNSFHPNQRGADAQARIVLRAIRH